MVMIYTLLSCVSHTVIHNAVVHRISVGIRKSTLIRTKKGETIYSNANGSKQRDGVVLSVVNRVAMNFPMVILRLQIIRCDLNKIIMRNTVAEDMNGFIIAVYV